MLTIVFCFVCVVLIMIRMFGHIIHSHWTFLTKSKNSSLSQVIDALGSLCHMNTGLIVSLPHEHRFDSQTLTMGQFIKN